MRLSQLKIAKLVLQKAPQEAVKQFNWKKRSLPAWAALTHVFRFYAEQREFEEDETEAEVTTLSRRASASNHRLIRKLSSFAQRLKSRYMSTVDRHFVDSKFVTHSFVGNIFNRNQPVYRVNIAERSEA